MAYAPLTLAMVRIFSIFFVVFWIQPVFAGGLPSLVVWAEDFKPFGYRKNNEITGFSTDLVRGLIEESGIEVSQWYLAPWPRAYFEARTTPNSLLYSIVRKSDREEYFHWIGPISPRRIFLVKLRSRVDIQADSMNQKKDLIVGVKRGSVAEESLISRKIKTIGVINEYSQFRMLLQGRTDLTAISDYSLYFNAKETGVSLDTFEVIEIIDESMDYYIALNRETDMQIVAALQTTFSKMLVSGRLMDIRVKWFGQLSKSERNIQ
ncbi:MAG: ABC transporter substrate-binding protein [Sneathiella sp.]|nr:ABC transporter substrate-binding protein [Sneathiella sp.]